MPQPIKKCPQCGSLMKRGPLTAERGNNIIVIGSMKKYSCTNPVCDYNEVVEVKLEKKKLKKQQ